MSGKIYQGSRLVAQTNDAPLGFEDKGIELESLAQYEQLEKDGNLQEDVNYYIKDAKGIIRNNTKYDIADTDDLVNGSKKYSTEETKTGMYWIDGKPIYRKVLSAEVLASDNVPNVRLTINFNIGTTDIYQIVNLKGSIRVKGTNIYVECGGSYYVGDSPQLSTNLSSNNAEALCVLKNGTEGLAWMINKDLELTTIVEYTKTTD